MIQVTLQSNAVKPKFRQVGQPAATRRNEEKIEEQTILKLDRDVCLQHLRKCLKFIRVKEENKIK